ncbi:metallophosphoesterase family protein [Infirmifilum sp.]|uniref:metallophosphoesterase family protein n=1 Tax=Infirmifilum sp. TaxID=2856575 RepID=UPI003D103C68
MKILFVSDLHKTLESLEEMESVDWLLSIIDAVKPDYLISAGDMGEAITAYDLQRITSRTKAIIVYGNHENFLVIKDYCVRDGQVIELGNLKVSGINGLVEEDEERKGRRREYAFDVRLLARLSKRLEGVDVLVSHQPPYLPEVYPGMRYSPGLEAFTRFLYEVRPKLHLSGHMTGGCYTYYEFPWGGRYLRVDSSSKHRCYAVIEEDRVTVYERSAEIFAFEWG